MFQTVELGQSIDKAAYKAEVPELRLRLLDLQNRLRSSGFSTLVLISGVEGAGKSETVKVLHEWFDPRFIETHGFRRSTEDERQFPPFWRFWRSLPMAGKIGIFFGSWYTDPIMARAHGETTDSELVADMERIRSFERALVEDGTLIVKFWFHLSRADQKKRMKKLAKDPEQSWRVTELDWKNLERYDDFRAVSERALGLTGTHFAPWTLVDGADKRLRNLTVGRKLAHELERALARKAAPRAAGESSPGPEDTSRETTPREERPKKTVLDTVDLSLSVSDEEYDDELEKLQGKFGALCREFSARNIAAVFAFEGWDAAGKGGVIRRVAEAMDARHYSIVPVAAPTDEERGHHYLWRFWRHVPKPGRVTIFDRSWYGRVLVERVEGFATEAEWSRAYEEINEFERQLTDHGTVVEKFWLHIDRDEQLRRFNEREATPWKKFKITPDDWRNREKWDAYEVAVHDMVEKTSTTLAPWNLVPSNDKQVARLFTLRAIVARMQARLKMA